MFSSPTKTWLVGRKAKERASTSRWPALPAGAFRRPHVPSVSCRPLSNGGFLCRERKAFGKPIGEYQLTLVKLARMATLLTVSRQFTYAVGRLMDQGSGQMEASMVKLFTCRTAEWLTREAMQIHGGMGYAEESPVSRYFLDARVLSIFEGAEETLALKVIARSLIDAA
jgi:alkylation response protein AidB-like acyl-CoA dehydrogenase